MGEADPPDTAEDEPRPWEADPFQRRDAEPHRGHVLRPLSIAAVIPSAPGTVFPCLAFLGAPLALVVWWAAPHDLRRIRAGEMDPRGLEPTNACRVAALVCFTCLALSCLLWGPFMLPFSSADGEPPPNSRPAPGELPLGCRKNSDSSRNTKTKIAAGAVSR